MFKKAMIATVGFLIPFGVGELFLQTVDPYHYAEREDNYQYGKRIILRRPGQLDRLRAGAEATYLGKKTVISSQGWRSPEFAVPKPVDVFRILMLGGSVPYGWGVAQGDEYPRVLERMLNAAGLAGGRRIEVVNTGVPGWKLPESGRLLIDEGATIDPDLVLLTLVATDVPTERHLGRPGLFDSWPEVRRIRLLRAIENRFMHDTPGTLGQPYDAYEHQSEEGLRLVAAALSEFAKVTRRLGARFVVFDTLGRDITRVHCARIGVHRIEGYTDWKQRRSWEVCATDPHPNAAGHRHLANLIFAAMQDPDLWRK